jgi:[ribosomal protein S18]-alanine N-acetyltransferase
VSVLSRLLWRDDAHGLAIEPMRRRHLTDVMKIEEVSYPKPWTRNVFLSEMELARKGERHYLVAKAEGLLLGYAGLMFVTDDAHVTNIAVAADQQRRGVATRLLAELAWEAIHRGCDALTLEVRVSNSGAQSLYRKFGFLPAGVRQRYYENTEDAIVMWLHDIRTEAVAERLAALCPAAAAQRGRR